MYRIFVGRITIRHKKGETRSIEAVTKESRTPDDEYLRKKVLLRLKIKPDKLNEWKIIQITPISYHGTSNTEK